MQPYTIDVRKVEDLQMTGDRDALDQMFERAKSAIVNGAPVYLARSESDGKLQQFDELTTLEDLQRYREGVFKYL